SLTLRLLLAQALYRVEQRNKAMRVLAKAVRQGAAEGYVRAFLDEDAYLLTLLRDLRAVPTVLLEGVGEGGAEAPLRFIDKLLHEPPAAAAPVLPHGNTDAGMRAAANASELLTRKEIQVMRLAAEGLSNDEIAERLFVAETTVRTHLRNINVK